MQIFLYTLGIRFYGLAARLVGLFSKKARLFTEGRKNLFTDLEKIRKKHPGPCLWFHCASLGEFEQGRPLIEAWSERFPNDVIALSFFSPSGYEIRKNYDKADIVTYLPLDTPASARRFIEILQPEAAVFIKYEFWYHFAAELNRQNIPLLSVSSIFRKEQKHFFGQKRTASRQALEMFSYFFVQNEESVNLLQSIGIKSVTRAGDTRFDRVAALAADPKDIPAAAEFSEGFFTLVIGSSWAADLKVIAPVLDDFDKPIHIIIAPHEIGEADLEKTESFFKQKKTLRYSQAANSDFAGNDNVQVLIIDNIGMLSSLYYYADLAYVGGAFGKGLHNISEPACYGIPVVFGKKYSKFDEARALTERKGAFSVKNSAEFQELFYALYENDTMRTEAGHISKSYVLESMGAGEKVLTYLEKELKGY